MRSQNQILIVVSGHFGVGKTSLIKRLATERFDDYDAPTPGQKVTKTFMQLSKRAAVEILLWDAEASHSLQNLPFEIFQQAQAVLYVCDVSQETTYTTIQDQRNWLTAKHPDVLFKIVGNKTDLLAAGTLKEFSRNRPFFDILTSAKTGSNCKRLMQRLVHRILRND